MLTLDAHWKVALQALLRRSEVRTVVIRWAQGRQPQSEPRPEGKARGEAMDEGEMEAVCDLVQNADWTSIAVVEGVCRGAELELAMASALRVAAPDATMECTPSRRLDALVGSGRARPLAVARRPTVAQRALRVGLVDRVSATPLAAALALGRELNGGSWPAQRAIRRCVDGSGRLTLRGGRALEAAELPGLLAGRDAREGIAAFLERRPTRFN